ncbi:MAG: amidohydrolase [Oscillospiraceae bacterium]|nr:amidohydrolase [Oscillospiraceae bacterium]
MKTKFRNAKVLNKDFTITNGGLCVKDDVIACVFEGESCKNDKDGGESECKFDREIDCGGNLLIPSFKNAHTHSAMTFLRSRADDMPLQKWLHEQVFPQEAKLTAEHIHHFTKLAILEYLAGGTTAAFDMYFEPEAVASAAKDTGFRITMCGAANNFGTTPKVMRDFYERYKNSHELVDYKLGFHAEYTNSIENMTEIAEMSEHYKAPVFTHMSETLTEHEECISRHGKTPARLFTDLGMWNNGGGVFHAVHVSDDDVNIMSENGIFAVSNPGSNLKLASGIAPLTKMSESGVKIALGTDGAASNNALSMFREMYFACSLQKHLMNDASACPAYSAIEWATANSAKVMGLDNCDCLEPGKKADIVMIDLSRPSIRPHNNIVKNIVYSGDTSVVKMTMVNGKILYKDGEFFVGEDSVKIIEKAESLMRDFD